MKTKKKPKETPTIKRKTIQQTKENQSCQETKPRKKAKPQGKRKNKPDYLKTQNN